MGIAVGEHGLYADGQECVDVSDIALQSEC
jgi:hypothetical protein